MCRTRFLVSLLMGVWAVTSPALGRYDSHLAGWWPFDEGTGTTTYDLSGHGNDGTFVGSPQWVSGVVGGALAFGGDDNDQVELASVLPIGSTSNTIAVWIKVPLAGTEGLGASERVGNVLGNYSDNPNTNWELHSVGQMRLYWNNGQINAYGTTDLRDNTWHHVAWVRDKAADACYMYIDGQLEATHPSAGSDITFVTTHRIAGDNRGDPPCFHGSMDDCQIYSRALSQAEIQAVASGPMDYRLASSPQPADGGAHVGYDGVVLAWTPGLYAATHDVYFGMDSVSVETADRANPLDVLISQGQTATTYDVGALAFGQTYYWRIDEVNALPDSTIFKGTVWSFTTELFAYPIETIVATSNGISDEGAGPENTVDGSGLDEADLHSVDSADMWVAKAPDDEDLYIQYEFDRIYKLHEMLVWNYNVQFELMLGFGVKDVTIEYSEDGQEWVGLGDVELNQATSTSTYTYNTTVDLQGVAARFVRLTVNSAFGATGQYGLSEVRFMYIPAHVREPQPADGAADVSVESTLAWRAGRDAVSHEVYLGTDADALDLAATVEAASYDPGALNLGATYYWQVNAVQEAESWAGDLWSFATQEYLVVDDFESYTDDIDAGETIFDTWLDGWVNDTGSTVGHMTSPFAERNIVRSGSQSMPLFYDNTTAAVSEAELELAADWMASGIRSLSLYFYGDSDNTGQLYVKINGTEVPYDGDVDDIMRPVWQPWNIDLSAIGNVGDVRSLTIGVEGAGATGVVYIDDIRLYPHTAAYLTPMEPDDTNLKGWWTFDEGSGTVAADHSGQGNHATLVIGEPRWVSGKIDGALEFDGVRHQLALTSPLAIGSSSNTVTAWIKVPLVGTENLGETQRVGTVLGNYPDLANTNWELHSAGQLRLHWDDGDIDLRGTTDLRTNTWQHIAFVRDKAADACYLYIDGRLEATHPSAGSDITFNTTHTIGGDNRDSGVPFFHGTIDDLRVYGEAMAPAEIAWLAGLRVPVHVAF